MNIVKPQENTMNNNFKIEDRVLIIDPTENDYQDLKIKFKENNAQGLYLAQVMGLSDENSYDTFIFFKKNGETFMFHEYENATHCSYSIDVKPMVRAEYFEKLMEFDRLHKEKFFEYALVDYNYKKLESEVPQKKNEKSKNHKL